jgi:hypothetical protein
MTDECDRINVQFEVQIFALYMTAKLPPTSQTCKYSVNKQNNMMQNSWLPSYLPPAQELNPSHGPTIATRAQGYVGWLSGAIEGTKARMRINYHRRSRHVPYQMVYSCTEKPKDIVAMPTRTSNSPGYVAHEIDGDLLKIWVTKYDSAMETDIHFPPNQVKVLGEAELALDFIISVCHSFRRKKQPYKLWKFIEDCAPRAVV